jgi:hypothetical protein
MLYKYDNNFAQGQLKQDNETFIITIFLITIDWNLPTFKWLAYLIKFNQVLLLQFLF